MARQVFENVWIPLALVAVLVIVGVIIGFSMAHHHHKKSGTYGGIVTDPSKGCLSVTHSKTKDIDKPVSDLGDILLSVDPNFDIVIVNSEGKESTHSAKDIVPVNMAPLNAHGGALYLKPHPQFDPKTKQPIPPPTEVTFTVGLLPIPQRRVAQSKKTVEFQTGFCASPYKHITHEGM